MADTTSPRPDETPSQDRGDETSRRYRFQWILAAISCCDLLDDTRDVLEVFCEQHEDVLLKHNDGQFSGLQIKTRGPGLGPWKTRDPEVQGSLVRFARLENDFPGQFRRFSFLTNKDIYRAENGQGLQYVLGRIEQATDSDDLEPVVRRVVDRVASLAECSVGTAFAALRKTRARDDLPKLDDAHVRLVQAVTGAWSEATSISYPAVVRAAHALEGECTRASSLAHTDTLAGYVPNIPEADDAGLLARVEGKRFDAQRVRGILERSITEVAPLYGDPGAVEDPSSGLSTTLRTKLDAGGFSAVSLNSAEDLRDKAEVLALMWQQKWGIEEGLQRYSHVQSIVLADAASAFEENKAQGDPFGVPMLTTLRSRLNERLEASRVYDSSLEHLEGFAYGLTAQCKASWSLARPWEDE